MKVEALRTADFTTAGQAYDAVLCASGYERRSRQVLSVATNSRGRLLCIGFAEHVGELSRPDNDRAFAEAGAEVRVLSGLATSEIRRMTRDVLESVPDGGRLLIDITSMTRVWHAAIVAELLNANTHTALQTTFLYIPALFAAPPERFPRTKHVAPLPGFVGFGLPNLPTALVVGLGYEPERALGLQVLLDPTVTASFIARNASEARYLTAVLERNSDFLSNVSEEWLFEYSLGDPARTFHVLESVCAGLARDHRVVLASLGPKMFGVLCLFVASVNPAVSVWRVSSGSSEPKEAEGCPESAIGLDVSWIESPLAV